LRVYSFDADLDLSGIATLETIYKVTGDLPALVVNEKLYTGFQSIETIEKLIPDLKKSLEKTQETTKTTTTPKSKSSTKGSTATGVTTNSSTQTTETSVSEVKQ
jgi:hypothetical protein